MKLVCICIVVSFAVFQLANNANAASFVAVSAAGDVLDLRFLPNRKSKLDNDDLADPSGGFVTTGKRLPGDAES